MTACIQYLDSDTSFDAAHHDVSDDPDVPFSAQVKLTMQRSIKNCKRL